jgi:glutaconate CoA-transferase, subunit A
MTQFLHTDIEALAALIPDGATIILPKGEGPDAPIALTTALIRRGTHDLRLITLPACAAPVSGMMVDMLIGAGCVAHVETSGVSLGELGPAPRFNAAVTGGTVAITDSTCPALYAAVQAGGKGQPFTTLRGLIGTDLAARREDWAEIENPFRPGDRVMALRAINPDVAIFHAPKADSEGNLWVGRGRDLLYAAHASHKTLATVDEIVVGSFYDDPALVAGVIPAFYIDAIAHVPGGSLPMRMDGSTDLEAVKAYARAARSESGFADWLKADVFDIRDAAE